MRVSIKPARSQDWLQIQQLNFQVFENDQNSDEDLDLNWPQSESGIKYYKKLANGKYGRCLIAWQGDEAVGYVALSIKKFDYRLGKYFEIENIGVSPSYRSKGVGQQLIEAALPWAKEQGASRLFVEAYWANQAAIKFYKNNGFEEMGLQLERRLNK